MPKQSPADPRFRCNECKDYYSAPEHKVHYQCAPHGYLCEKHVISEKSENCGVPFRGGFYVNRQFVWLGNYYSYYGPGRVDGSRNHESKVPFGTSSFWLKHWKLSEEDLEKNKELQIEDNKKFVEKYGNKCGVFIDEFCEKNGLWMYIQLHDKKNINDSYCLKTPVKYNWHEDVERWIEEGREKEEKAKAKPKKAATKKHDPTAEIRKYAKLRDDGLITEEDYEAKKKELLGL